MIDFYLDQIEDPIIKENFEKLRVYLTDLEFLSQLKFFEFQVKNPSPDYRFKHNLGFLPKDVIITNVSLGTATPNFNSINKDYVSLNVSDPCVIRMLLGSMK